MSKRGEETQAEVLAVLRRRRGPLALFGERPGADRSGFAIVRVIREDRVGQVDVFP